MDQLFATSTSEATAVALGLKASFRWVKSDETPGELPKVPAAGGDSTPVPLHPYLRPDAQDTMRKVAETQVLGKSWGMVGNQSR
jgi:hypothetical protein